MFWRRPESNITQKNTVVAIGNFDGVHVGHQKILAVTKEIAEKNDFIPVLLTFEPYPQQFFHPENPVPRLTTLQEKINIINRLDVNLIYALPFDRLLSLYSPEKFVTEILIQKLNAKYVVVGEDFRYGYQRKGDIKLLQNFLETKVISPVLLGEERIRSTAVRQALSEGDLSLAQKLLGRPYGMTGRVVKGHQRGRQLGFLTANIALNKRIAPLKGVFAVKVNGNYRGVANIGTRPTVDGNGTFLEVHVFDFNQDIYGQYLHIEFIHKIRNEVRFESLEALKAQIAQDVTLAKSKLN